MELTFNPKLLIEKRLYLTYAVIPSRRLRIPLCHSERSEESPPLPYTANKERFFGILSPSE